MRYVAIDTETTGLDQERDQVLQVAMVFEDTAAPSKPVDELLYFEGLVYHERIEGHPVAISMNYEIIKTLAWLNTWLDTCMGSVELHGRSVTIYQNIKLLCAEGLQWLKKVHEEPGDAKIPLLKPRYGSFVAAGKNAAGFDLPFLPSEFRQAFHYRVIDVGSVALGAELGRWEKPSPPGLRELLDTIHGPDEPRGVTHDALEDARDVVRLLRWFTNAYRGEV